MEGVARSELQTSSSLSVTTNKEIERRPDLQTLTSVLKYTLNILGTGLVDFVSPFQLELVMKDLLYFLVAVLMVGWQRVTLQNLLIIELTV